MRTNLLRKKRILSKRLRSQKGASVVFAIVGFMFAAMISLVVVNAAYSAASRVRKLKYDEQAFLLAQSMSGIITDALAGNGSDMKLPDNTALVSPTDTSQSLKYDGLTVNYQYIEQTESTGETVTINRFYNADENGTAFTKSTATGTSKKTFYDTVKGRTTPSLSAAGTAVRTMVRDMARLIDQGQTSVTETLTIDKEETLEVVTDFTMDSSYSLKAVITAKVKKGSNDLSKYIVRIDANAAVRTDKLICVGTKSTSGETETITVTFSDTTAEAVGEELVKVCCYSVMWPPKQISVVYVTPSETVTPPGP